MCRNIERGVFRASLYGTHFLFFAKKGVLKMFENVGRKLKLLSKILMISSLILGIIAGISIIENRENPFWGVGILTIILSPIVSYISFLPMYGIGEIIDEINSTKEYRSRFLENNDTEKDCADKASKIVLSHAKDAPVVILDNHNECFCPGCNRALTFDTSFGIKQCVHCKKYFKVVKNKLNQ